MNLSSREYASELHRNYSGLLAASGSLFIGWSGLGCLRQPSPLHPMNSEPLAASNQNYSERFNEKIIPQKPLTFVKSTSTLIPDLLLASIKKQ